MNADVIRWILVLVLLAELLLSAALDILNLLHARSKIGNLPDKLNKCFDTGFQQKAFEYLRSKTQLGLVSDLLHSVLCIVLILSGILAYLDGSIRSLGFGMYTNGLLFFISLSAAFLLLDIPFRLFSVFYIEERFGFNKTTATLWLIDFLKEVLLSALIGLPLLIVLFWFVEVCASWWWLYAFLFLSAVELFIAFVYPIWIAPLFNKFTPIAPGSLKDAIEKMAERLSFAFAGIFTMDGSRRSAHANAFFLGFGKYKRIVLFDTLISQLGDEELLAVLAHEIGHAKLHHVKKMLFLSLLSSFVGFWLLSMLMTYQPIAEAFGFGEPAFYAMFTACIFVLSPLSLFITPVLACLSRRFEYEADEFAAKALGDSEDLGRALVKISEKSLSNLTPHPWYSFFHYSHPTLCERLEAFERL